MKFEIITASSAQFVAASRQIIDLYNAEQEFFQEEDIEVRFPELIFVIRPAGVAGGIIVDRTKAHPEQADVMYAAFAPEHRGKGYLRACINKANQYLKKRGSRILSVSLNPTDKTEVWKHLGFTYDATVNLVPRLFNTDPAPLFPAHEQRDGLTLEDLISMTGKNPFADWD